MKDGNEIKVGATRLGKMENEILKQNEEHMSYVQKILLSAFLLGNEASQNILQVFILPISQTLGLPLDITFVTLFVSGSVAGVLIPCIGWLSDKGSNPTRRKALAVVLAACFLLTGLSCLAAANAIHLNTTEPGQAIDPDHAQATDTDHAQATHTEGGRLTTDLREAANATSMNLNVSISHVQTAQNCSANASGYGVAEGQGRIPFKAGLAMFGFILLDIGLDSSYSFTKSWMVTCSPRGEHTSVLGTGLIMASAGAIFVCLMTNVGMDAFNSMGRISLPVRAIIDAVFVIVLILLSLTLTLLVGTRRLTSGKIVEQEVNMNTKSYNSMDRTDQNDKRNGHIETGLKEDQISPKTSTGVNSSTFRYDKLTNETDSDTDLGRKGNQNSPKTSTAVNSSPFDYEKLTNETDSDSTTCALTTTQKGIDAEQRCSGVLKPKLCGTEQSLKLKVCLICVSAYFSFATLLLNSINVPDFVGKAVYGGHPEGHGDTDSAERYQAGVTMAAWGFVVYYSVYMVLSSVHTHVLNLLGYKIEFVLIQLATSGSLVLLILTARVEAFFWSLAVAGTQRVCTHVIPFAVINDVMQAEVEKDVRAGSARVGLGMSIVSVMSSLAMITIFPCLGPLEEVTRLVSIPLWIAAGCGCAAAACFLVIDIPRKR